MKDAKLNVVFDLDGTLIDSCPGIEAALSAAFIAAGRVMPAADLRAIIGPPIRTIATRVEPALTEVELVQIERTFRTTYDGDGWRKTILFEGVAETLQGLHLRGYKMFIVTNKPRIPTEKVLTHLGLTHLFQRVITRDGRIPGYGSKVEMLTELLQQQLLEPQSTIMVGDTREDEEAALANSLSFIYAAYGYGSIHAPQSPITVFSELSTLLADINPRPQGHTESA